MILEEDAHNKAARNAIFDRLGFENKSSKKRKVARMTDDTMPDEASMVELHTEKF